MHADILRTGIAATVTEEARQRLHAAGHKFGAENIQSHTGERPTRLLRQGKCWCKVCSPLGTQMGKEVSVK
ncbi:MAG: hypothetical protein OHK0011_08950 [Turneriella sp.]